MNEHRIRLGNRHGLRDGAQYELTTGEKVEFRTNAEGHYLFRGLKRKLREFTYFMIQADDLKISPKGRIGPKTKVTSQIVTKGEMLCGMPTGKLNWGHAAA